MVEPLILDKEDLFLVEVRVKGDSRNMRVQILVDGDGGIDIDQCASISRQLGHLLEEEEVIDGKYVLEVSSPGLDQPLRMIRQYVKNINRELKIKTKGGQKLKAMLLDVADEKLELEKNDGQKIEMPITEIEEAKVIVSFK